MSLPYYPMYPADFDGDVRVRVMEDCELGLYVRCLNHAWMNDGLPADPEEIRRCFRDEPTAFAKKWARVEPCFPLGEDGKRRNPRQERERASIEEKHARRVRSGKRSGQTRRANQEKTGVFSSEQCSNNVRTRAFDSDSDSISGSSQSRTTEKTSTRAREEKPDTSGENAPASVAPEQTIDAFDVEREWRTSGLPRLRGSDRTKLHERFRPFPADIPTLQAGLERLYQRIQKPPKIHSPIDLFLSNPVAWLDSIARTADPPAAQEAMLAQNDGHFETVIGVFLSLGVALSENDMKKCAAEWVALDMGARIACLGNVRFQSAEWSQRAVKFVPRPWNYLRERQWERKAIVNGRDKSASHSETTNAKAFELFMRDQPQ